jgi:hypothetical protein
MTTIVEIFENFKGLLDFAPQAVAIFKDYPIAALVLLGLGFLAAWWLRGAVDAGEIRGLNAQTEGLKKDINRVRMQLAVRDERLQLAKQREETLTHAMEQVTAGFNRLHEQIKTSASPALISEATSTAQAIGEMIVANIALRSTLSVRWLRY